MYVGKDEVKKQHYIKTIQQWLQNSQYDIYIVESSGYTFEIQHPRLHQYSFVQSKGNKNLSLLGKDSLLKIYNHFNWNKYDYIFKITGKYFISDFDPKINDADLIVQNQVITHGQNSELVGIKTDKFVEIISGIQNNFESHLYHLIESGKYKICRLPAFYLDTYYPRNDGSVLRYL